jgi:molybdopterin-containing oxidoreductase family membrane subunit
VESGLLFGTVGLFATLLLLFARFLPVVSMAESRHQEHEERA